MAGVEVVSNLAKAVSLSMNQLRRSQDVALRYTTERLVEELQSAPCVWQNERPTAADV